MKQIYPFFASNNVSRIQNMQPMPGRILKTNKCLLKEGFFLNPSVPWEQRIDNGYPNVFYDEDFAEYRCYYTCFIRDDASVNKRPEQKIHDVYNFQRRELFRPRIAGILLATSKDGIYWERPNLSICEFEGNSNNNILMDNVHGASVFKDYNDKDPNKRYKMMVRHDAHEKMAVGFSSDGIHWGELIDWPKHNPAGDTHNYAFWDEREGKYVLNTRTWSDGLRLSARCESNDFINWSTPIESYRGDGLDDQLYSMPIFWHNNMYLGLGSIFHGGDCASVDFDCVDCELLYSYDTHHWNRASKGKPLIPRSLGYYGDDAVDCGCIYASAPVKHEDRSYIYYFGSNGQHTNFRETTLMRAEVDLDALVGYEAKNERGGSITTCRVRITGDELLVKANLASNARISACISKPFGIHDHVNPEKGFESDDCTFESVGDNLWLLKFVKPLSSLKDGLHCITISAENAMVFGFGGDIAPIYRTI